jgi:4-aminobutyrate aminotransferase/4-aminobutyrate aminotransferase/(S)-3-amino-2-methylpropionate transaminase
MGAWPSSEGEAIHTSTFLGNPLGCAMALASLEELRSKNLASKAQALGRWWLEELQGALGHHPRVGEIRGLGMMVGVEFVKDKKSLAPDPQWTNQVVVKALKAGLIVLSGGLFRNVLTLTPPLTIRRAELGRATKILKEALFGKP